MFNLYENIRAIAAEHGYSPSGLMLAMGKSKSVMSNLRVGKIETLSSSTLQQIADFLGEPYDRVAHGKEKSPAPESEAMSDEVREIIKIYDEAPPELKRMMLAMMRSAADNK